MPRLCETRGMSVGNCGILHGSTVCVQQRWSGSLRISSAARLTSREFRTGVPAKGTSAGGRKNAAANKLLTSDKIHLSRHKF